ncbi:hypothetical protein M431DRAFT_507851 [Trichoderma harzianum CBS 226.95]|uniref:Uncharacterized protein n=1 Tax=Trichoderma harzianum CBS 226.95 TaxID=983964 RepID=A0A2T4AH03_TRIHA|nr:hypothetical protein M431DRAFT_514387 [Trichoderma harzianum CBS 226.95]XP_024767870.1 hypothetical protein M431DRAFT_513935 [Trichoderma harzianum CBS 226.95]XP_024775875.1 hypothetical protein M431DRAFT_507851 [Trichoderma harzianum CBS 226.95]PTB47437.1 hypothetical protein M431DRAFT_514387 [Trichoderma harzianum CBS 226.95]PTB48193.1 hypothetical protein M431DRAFT_513935 [Trichoderma harzianum CBS 226.95]PTB56198.1 hypothetical protein M431DRAFT_507851 [Trichoderma harzianum CBS 226.95]
MFSHSSCGHILRTWGWHLLHLCKAEVDSQLSICTYDLGNDDKERLGPPLRSRPS